MRLLLVAPEPLRDEVGNNFLSKGLDLAYQLIRGSNGPEHELGAALINIGLDFLHTHLCRPDRGTGDQRFG